ncbi:hypothetical protein L6452_33087 [Arctium lappa]|uniref:Uncharacterized protein n=1 Tax=Arctium lappa TaxID=4217 RepID=A0ACB8Z7I3_ARCLA|nr:hypothetical protein L6452_33087 [Arctium lappa]
MVASALFRPKNAYEATCSLVFTTPNSQQTHATPFMLAAQHRPQREFEVSSSHSQLMTNSRYRFDDCRTPQLLTEVGTTDAQDALSDDDDDVDYDPEGPPATPSQPLLTSHDQATRLLEALQTVTVKVDLIAQQLEDRGYIRICLTGERRQAQKSRQGSTSSSPRPE